tara:strand:- start:84 stop:284 length:201 start_codon:yes stop_codon:yes gene_type:complete
MESTKNDIYWVDGFNGKAAGGLFIRNSLVETIKQLEAQGKKVVGIKYDGTWNLELIIEIPGEENKN